jgi:lipopolysaccharide export system protein LptA
MKKIVFLLLALAGGLALAQTNAPASKTPPHRPTVITSDSADFDLNIHQAIYRGHVLVDDPKVKMQCELLLVDLPTGGEHLTNVVSDKNVVIDFTDEKGQTHHVTADRAVYAYSVVGSVTNETVTFTGNPKVESPESTILSEPLVWDRAANKFHFFNQTMTFRQNLNGFGTGTNAGNPAALKFN